MQDLIKEIVKEHVQIRRILSELLGVVDADKLEVKDLKRWCRELEVLWNVHEAKEDHIFNHMKKYKFPEEKSILEQHRELKGHWKVLNDALNKGDELEIKVAMDTDGRMLADKFIKHMAGEEEYFDKISKEM